VGARHPGLEHIPHPEDEPLGVVFLDVIPRPHATPPRSHRFLFFT
jgi:hypothetical protein